MSFAFARAQRDAYLLLRMEAQEYGQSITLEDLAYEQQDSGLESEHRHGEACACHLRGE